MTVADRIRDLREKNNMTQEELAQKLGYTGKSSVSKIETSGNDITLKKISKIAPALHTSEAYLMGWTNDPNPILIENNQISDSKNEMYHRALTYYEKYLKASPEIRSAIDLLLRGGNN